MKISVCVPSYERPEMLEQLINSFLAQDYIDKELVVSDDSESLLVEELINRFNNEKIIYSKNIVNLGYSKNLMKSLQIATGEICILMGDDDIFIARNALSVYANVFSQNSDIGYAYSNQVQFSDQLKAQYRFNYFSSNTVFEIGEESLKNIWLSSVFIPGMAIRNVDGLTNDYPLGNMLFPQVLLTGRILNKNKSYGISDYLIGGRSHSEQLGFYAIKGERIKGSEKHGTIELIEIFNQLLFEFRLEVDESFLIKELLNRYTFMILKERILTSRKNVATNYFNFCHASDAVKKSKKLKLAFITSQILPAWFLKLIRLIVVRLSMFLNKKNLMYHEINIKNIILSENCK